MMRRLLLLLSLLMAVSCADRSSFRQFVRSEDAVDGVYGFTLELSSACAYDMWICTRDDALSFSGTDSEPLRLDLRWVSPSGESWEETVYMPDSGLKGKAEAYRVDSVPSETGEWKLYIKPAAASRSFRGIGFICTSENGTR